LPWSVAVAAFLLAYALRAHKFPQAFVWLGTISYSVYLFHPAVARIVLLAPLPAALSFFVVLAAVILTATCTYNFVEQPFIRLGKQIQRRVATTTVILPPVDVKCAARYPISP
jgi:peptidoglycan/LPS O-acetylase OafA/YrhL